MDVLLENGLIVILDIITIVTYTKTHYIACYLQHGLGVTNNNIITYSHLIHPMLDLYNWQCLLICMASIIQ